MNKQLVLSTCKSVSELTEKLYGQAVYEMLLQSFPVEVNFLTGTDFDCYYDDSKVEDDESNNLDGWDDLN